MDLASGSHVCIVPYPIVAHHILVDQPPRWSSRSESRQSSGPHLSSDPSWTIITVFWHNTLQHPLEAVQDVLNRWPGYIFDLDRPWSKLLVYTWSLHFSQAVIIDVDKWLAWLEWFNQNHDFECENRRVQRHRAQKADFSAMASEPEGEWTDVFKIYIFWICDLAYMF